MMLFKEYFQQRMDDRKFRNLYETQCHICSTTVRVIGRIEEQGRSDGEVAAACGIPLEALITLRSGDFCDPRVVQKLCAGLGLGDPADMLRNCSRFPRE